jgi:hypothetical protein
MSDESFTFKSTLDKPMTFRIVFREGAEKYVDAHAFTVYGCGVVAFFFDYKNREELGITRPLFLTACYPLAAIQAFYEVFR